MDAMSEWERLLTTDGLDRPESGEAEAARDGWVRAIPWPQTHRRLSWKEEVALARRIERGDQEARQQLIEANYGLVLAEANRYRSAGVPVEDLVQEGMIGLVRAVDKFDYRRGSRFSTCAMQWIRAHVLHAAQELKPLVHVPERVGRAARQVARVAERLQQELGREPTSEEIAERTPWPAERVSHLLQVTDSYLSLNVPVENDEGEDNFQDLLADPGGDLVADRALRGVLAEQVAADLQRLNPREAEVLRLRFGLDDGEEWTLAQIGRRFNLSRQRVRSIEQEALTKLRQVGQLGRRNAPYYAAMA
jgi:RNA polymerase primary sigma factor